MTLIFIIVIVFLLFGGVGWRGGYGPGYWGGGGSLVVLILLLLLLFGPH